MTKYRGFTYRDCNISLTLNHKTPMVIRNLKKYVSHLTMQELGKFNLKINFTSNGLEKYLRFTINSKSSLVDSSQLQSSSLYKLVKNLSEDEFKYLSQEFVNNVLDPIKQ